MLSSNAEDGSETMLVDNELKQKQQFDKIDRMVKGRILSKQKLLWQMLRQTSLPGNNQRTSFWLNALKVGEGSSPMHQYLLRMMSI